MHTKNSISVKHKTPATRMLRLVAIFFLTVQTTVFAQKPADNSRAQRDIVVLRNLMNEYFQNANPEPKKYVLSQSRSDIKYFPGFGLLISAPTYQLFNNRMSFNYAGDCDCEDDAKKAEADIKKEAAATLPENDKIIGIMKDFVAEYPNLMDIIQPSEKVVFYYDKTYRLGSGDVIVINRSYSTAATATESSKAKPRERIMLTFAPSDLKLTPAELKNKIKVKTETQEEKTKPEFNIMGKIFADVFDNTSRSKFQASNQYFTFSTTGNTSIESRSRANYEYFEGLGIIYKFEASYQGFRSSYYRNVSRAVGIGRVYPVTVNGQAVIVEDGAVKEGQNEKQKDKSKEKEKTKTPRAPEPARADDEPAEETRQNNAQKVADDYRIFVQDVKNYLIEYGRTLRSLAPNERLVVTVKLNRIDRYLMPAQAPGETEKSTKTDGFQLPRQVELSVPKSVLDEYDKRSLSLEEAAAKVTLREYAKNETASSATSFWFEVED